MEFHRSQSSHSASCREISRADNIVARASSRSAFAAAVLSPWRRYATSWGRHHVWPHGSEQP